MKDIDVYRTEIYHTDTDGIRVILVFYLLKIQSNLTSIFLMSLIEIRTIIISVEFD